MRSVPNSVAASLRADIFAAIVLGFVALVTRVAIVASAPQYPLITDMQEYFERALYILQHGAFHPSAWRLPGYPAALALAFKLGGPSLEVARVLNALAGTATVLLTYWLARRTASLRASVVAALVVALYPSFLLYTTLVVTEPIVTVPMLGALIAASYGSRRASVVAGVCTGLATLIRPAGIASLPAVAAALARQPNADGRVRWTLLHPALVAVMFLAMMTPWWVHNLRVHSRFVPLDTTGGHALLVGNVSYATGTWEWKVAGPMQLNLQERGVDWTTPAGADETTAMAISSIRADPAAFVWRTPAKMAALLALEGRELAVAYSLGYFGNQEKVVVWLWGLAIIAAFPLLLIVAMTALAIRRSLEPSTCVPALLLIGVMLVMHMITYGDPRYHLPMIPVLAVLATGIVWWDHGFVRWRVLAGLAVVLWLSSPWSRQLTTYLMLLAQLAGPDGWKHPVPAVDLL